MTTTRPHRWARISAAALAGYVLARRAALIDPMEH